MCSYQNRVFEREKEQLIMSTAEFPGWYVEFQTAVLRQLPRPGEIDQTTAKDWGDNQAGLKKNLADFLCQPKSDFNPHTFFQTREGLWVSRDFQTEILMKIAPNAVGQIILVKGMVLESKMFDSQIEKKLGNNHLFEEATLCVTIAKLLQVQWGGNKGELSTDGKANIFYTSSSVVIVSLRIDEHKWGISARRRNSDWIAGDKVFSPRTPA